MFREMRRKDRAMEPNEAMQVLQACEYGFLATKGDGDFPYATPYNYVMADGKIYIHCTNKESHKRDDIRANPNVCFAVVGQTHLMPEKFATTYESVIVFGTAREVEDDSTRRAALEGMIRKYSPGFEAEGMKYIEKLYAVTTILEITPLHITGKTRRAEGPSNVDFLKKK